MSSSNAAKLNRIFTAHRACFSPQPVEGVVRRRDCCEPDGGERVVVAYRVITAFFAHDMVELPSGANIPRGAWYPQDQAWDNFLSDIEFYAHYRVQWPITQDTTNRQRLLQAQIDRALEIRSHRYIEVLAAHAAMDHSQAAVTGLLDQYRQLFGSPEPEER
jgi:hypothetical protein